MSVLETVLAAGESPPDYLGPLAGLVVAAAVIGYLTARVRVVPIVGFLAAGVLIGPYALKVVPDGEVVQSAADIGVILLLFTIGIEFSLERLARVWTWIVVGGVLQVLLATGAGAAVTRSLGGGWGDAVYTGFLLALSSTAIVLKVLAARGEASGTRGRLALAVLIAQDLAVVAMVLVVPSLGPEAEGGLSDLPGALAVAAAVVAGVILVARRVMPVVLDVVARACSPEVFLLAVVATCFGTAYLTARAGVSVSLGAFLAGLVVSESRASTQAFAEVLPLQIIFSAVFFVSVGMLLDLRYVAANLLLVLAAAAAVLALKTLTTTLAVVSLGVGWRTAVGTALLLAQVGEFSFVLLSVGTASGLSPLGLDSGGDQLVVATTVLLMVSTPLLAALGGRIERSGGRAAAGADGAGTAVTEPADDEGRVVILGWGPTALDLAATVARLDVPVLMTTLNPDGAAEAEAAGHRVLRGDPTKSHVLREAGVPSARLVVVAEDEPEQAARVTSAARPLTAASILVRPLGSADVAGLAAAGADHVVDRDRVSDRALTRSVLQRLGRTAGRRPGRTVVDTSRVVRYRWPATDGCGHGAASLPVLPAAPGCVDCLRDGTDWVHLRTCLRCGNIGCCDSSPQRHARAHAAGEDHPLAASAEPGDTWAYCFVDDVTVAAPAPD